MFPKINKKCASSPSKKYHAKILNYIYIYISIKLDKRIKNGESFYTYKRKLYVGKLFIAVKEWFNFGNKYISKLVEYIYIYIYVI